MKCMIEDKKLRDIFYLKSNIENIFFKAYMNSLTLPVKLNQTHVITVLMLHFDGESPMSEISSRLNLEKGSFTPVANTLIKVGYIEKSQSKTDRRVYNIKLTEDGIAFAEAFKKSHFEFMKSKISELTLKDQNAFIEAVNTLNQLLEKLI